MTQTSPDVPGDRSASPAAPVRRGAAAGRFVWHLAEMLIAMMVGMFALGPAWRWALGAFDAAAVLDSPVVAALVMATDMTIGMSLWMAIRRHSWGGIAEMGLAMYLSFAVLFPPYWLCWISGAAIMGIGHVLMVVAMVLVMLRRRDEYTRGHARH